MVNVKWNGAIFVFFLDPDNLILLIISIVEKRLKLKVIGLQVLIDPQQDWDLSCSGSNVFESTVYVLLLFLELPIDLVKGRLNVLHCF